MKGISWTLLVFLPIIVNSLKTCKENQFEEFKLKYNKVYADETEEQYRFKVFAANLKIIKNHNKLFEAGIETNTLTVNKFADMTSEEFTQMLSASVDETEDEPPQRRKRQAMTTIEVPKGWKATTLDLRTDDIPVKNQLTCGSCWTFPAVAVFEYMLYKKFNVYSKLSEQMCLECAKPKPDGCLGGMSDTCLKYFLKKGVNYDFVYPYTGTNVSCKYKDTTIIENGMPNDTARAFGYVPQGEKLLAYIVSRKGWTIVGVNASKWQLHEKGVIRKEACSLKPNHSVVAVGYGYDVKAKKKYWLLRNSWGPTVGENGYYRIERDANACDINTPVYRWRAYLK